MTLQVMKPIEQQEAKAVLWISCHWCHTPPSGHYGDYLTKPQDLRRNKETVPSEVCKLSSWVTALFLERNIAVELLTSSFKKKSKLNSTLPHCSEVAAEISDTGILRYRYSLKTDEHVVILGCRMWSHKLSVMWSSRGHADAETMNNTKRVKVNSWPQKM